jgi:hypothetical protein
VCRRSRRFRRMAPTARPSPSRAPAPNIHPPHKIDNQPARLPHRLFPFFRFFAIFSWKNAIFFCRLCSYIMPDVGIIPHSSTPNQEALHAASPFFHAH